MSSNDFPEEKIYAFVTEAGMYLLWFKSVTSNYVKNYMTDIPEESFLQPFSFLPKEILIHGLESW